jgi:hypothetical protein
VLALLQLLLPDVASNQRVAVLINTMPEVLARHAHIGTPAVLQLPIIHIAPLLHNPSP